MDGGELQALCHQDVTALLDVVSAEGPALEQRLRERDGPAAVRRLAQLDLVVPDGILNACLGLARRDVQVLGWGFADSAVTTGLRCGRRSRPIEAPGANLLQQTNFDGRRSGGIIGY